MMKCLKKSAFIFLVFLMPCFYVPSLAQHILNNNEITQTDIQNLLNQCEYLKQNPQHGKDLSALKAVATKGLSMVSAEDASDRARFYYYLGYGYYLFYMSVNDNLMIDSMQYAYKQSLSESQKIRAASLIAKASMALIHLYYEMRDTQEQEKYKNILQPIIDTITDKNILREGYAALADYYQNKSYYTTAQDYSLKAIELTRAQTDTSRNPGYKQNLAGRYYSLARLYLKTGMSQEAINSLNSGLVYCVPHSDLANLFHSMLIEAFCKNGNIDSALSYLHGYVDPNEIFYKKKGAVHNDVISANMVIAQYYIDQENYKAASPFVNKSISLANFKPDSYNNFLYPVQKMAGQYYLETKDYQRAIDTLSKALPIAKALSREDEAGILKYLALSQKGLNNNKAAVQYFEQYTLLSDSLTKEKVSRNFADFQTHYQTNEKQNQIASLDQKNKLNILELKQASNTRTLMILGLISLGIFSLLLYFIYRNKEKLNQILNDRNTQLDALNNQLSVANDTKAKLFGIIGHDLRSPVSRIVQMLKIQKERPELLDEDSKKQHEENLKLASENVLETMEDLLLWSKSQMQNFKPDFKNVLITEVVTKESSFLKDHADAKNIQIQNAIPEDFSLKTDENFLEIIIRNLLQNAVKYSSEGAFIDITSNGFDCINIHNKIPDANLDNFRAGIQNEFVNSKSSGLGLQIAKDLASAIGVKIIFELQENQNLKTSIVWENNLHS